MRVREKISDKSARVCERRSSRETVSKGGREGGREKETEQAHGRERERKEQERGGERKNERVRTCERKYQNMRKYVFFLYCTRVRGNVRIYIEKYEKICMRIVH